MKEEQKNIDDKEGKTLSDSKTIKPASNIEIEKSPISQSEFSGGNKKMELNMGNLPVSSGKPSLNEIQKITSSLDTETQRPGTMTEGKPKQIFGPINPTSLNTNNQKLPVNADEKHKLIFGQMNQNLSKNNVNNLKPAPISTTFNTFSEMHELKKNEEEKKKKVN